MTLYVCSYCSKLAVTLWPVTLDGKEREVCWTCIEEAARQSRFVVAKTLDGEVTLRRTIKSVGVGS